MPDFCRQKKRRNKISQSANIFTKICLKTYTKRQKCNILLNKKGGFNNAKNQSNSSYRRNQKRISRAEENIQTAAASIKEMKTTRRTLRKELELAQAKEAEEKQAEEIKELTELMKEKGVTVEYLKSLMQ